MEINTSSSANIVQLAKTKAITDLLTYATAFLGPTFSCHATQKLGNPNVLYNKKGTLRAKALWNFKFLKILLSDETKTSEGKVILNF